MTVVGGRGVDAHVVVITSTGGTGRALVRVVAIIRIAIVRIVVVRVVVTGRGRGHRGVAGCVVTRLRRAGGAHIGRPVAGVGGECDAADHRSRDEGDADRSTEQRQALGYLDAHVSLPWCPLWTMLSFAAGALTGPFRKLKGGSRRAPAHRSRCARRADRRSGSSSGPRRRQRPRTGPGSPTRPAPAVPWPARRWRTRRHRRGHDRPRSRSARPWRAGRPAG